MNPNRWWRYWGLSPQSGLQRSPIFNKLKIWPSYLWKRTLRVITHLWNQFDKASTREWVTTKISYFNWKGEGEEHETRKRTKIVALTVLTWHLPVDRFTYRSTGLSGWEFKEAPAPQFLTHFFWCCKPYAVPAPLNGFFTPLQPSETYGVDCGG